MGNAMSYRDRVQLEPWNSMARLDAITNFIGTEHITGKRVAELGASRGYLSAWALDMGCKHIVSVEKEDGPAEAIASMSQGADNATLVQANLFDIKLHNVDTYIASGIVYHVQRQVDLFLMMRSASVIYVESWIQKTDYSIQINQQADGYRHFLPSPSWIEYMAGVAGFKLSRSGDIPGAEGRMIFEFT